MGQPAPPGIRGGTFRADPDLSDAHCLPPPLGFNSLPTMTGWLLILLCAIPAVALASTLVPHGIAPRRDGCCRIIFFDGECGLCDRVVRTLMRADRAGLLRFAPLQGRTAGLLLPEALRREALESTLVYYREGPGPHSQRLVRDEAVLAVCDDIGAPLRLLTIFRLLPRPWRRAAYRWVAGHRHHLAPTACALPSAPRDDRLLP